MDDLAAGDAVELKRAHPCGSTQFVVTLVGLDIRLSCAGCGARLILSRARLQARLRAVHPCAGPLHNPSVDPPHNASADPPHNASVDPMHNPSVNPLHRGES